MFLKLETLQPTFSYKVRGAFNAVLRLVEEHGRPLPPLVTASAGNHGRALAYAARAAGVPLTVYMPERAPRTKVEAVMRAGAALMTCASYDEAEARAGEHAARGDALFISPYAHPDVIAGAGTVGLEILEEGLDIESIVVPTGGGGLISGIAIAARGQAGVTGVEVEASCPYTKSLAAGRIVAIDVKPTLADGLAGNLDPAAITFDIVRELVERVALVGENDVEDAVRGVALEERLVVEGAGAVGVAAVASLRLDLHGARTAIVLSGANIDPGTLRRVF